MYTRSLQGNMERRMYSKLNRWKNLTRRSSSTSTQSSCSTIKSRYSKVYLTNVSNRGNKESEQVETMVRKYLYKSHGKFRLVMIDID